MGGLRMLHDGADQANIPLLDQIEEMLSSWTLP